jgi:hypothetical protein
MAEVHQGRDQQLSFSQSLEVCFLESSIGEEKKDHPTEVGIYM